MLINLLVLLPVCYLSFFYNLSDPPLYIWDEARPAISALEMAESGNWLIPTFEGHPDMWSVKPPLLIILQVLCYKLVGYNELAVRLPSAFAALGTVLLIYRYLHYKVGSPLWALFSGLVMCGIVGYIQPHVARTGDYDSLLVFLLTGGFIQQLLFYTTGHNKHFYYSLIFFLLGVYTKGSAGLLFGPGLFLAYAVTGQLKKLLQAKLVAAVLLFLLLGLSYFFIREQYNPGYIGAVLHYEFFGRMTNKAEFDHDVPWYYLFGILFLKNYWLWLCAFIASFFFFPKARPAEKTMLLFCYVVMLAVMMFFAMSANKNRWYIAPLFPLYATGAAYGLLRVFEYVNEKINKAQSSMRLTLLLACFLPLVFVAPEVQVFDYIMNGEPVDYYGKAIRINSKVKSMKVWEDRYWPTIDFYERTSAADHRIVKRVRHFYQIKEGDNVLVYNDALRRRLESAYTVD
ncbi:MAG: ArnT family glycosyltransferase, partial [Bacteroidia bacterium]